MLKRKENRTKKVFTTYEASHRYNVSEDSTFNSTTIVALDGQSSIVIRHSAVDDYNA